MKKGYLILSAVIALLMILSKASFISLGGAYSMIFGMFSVVGFLCCLIILVFVKEERVLFAEDIKKGEKEVACWEFSALFNVVAGLLCFL